MNIELNIRDERVHGGLRFDIENGCARVADDRKAIDIVPICRDVRSERRVGADDVQQLTGCLDIWIQ